MLMTFNFNKISSLVRHPYYQMTHYCKYTEFFKGTFIRTPRVSNKVLEHHQITPSNIRVIKATNDLKIVSF